MILIHNSKYDKPWDELLNYRVCILENLILNYHTYIMPNVNCIKCNKEFYVKPSHQKLGYGKYCSRTCQIIGQRKGLLVKCSSCGKDTWKTPKDIKSTKSGKLFCSKSCQTKWRNKYFSDTLHPNWKDGKSKDYRRIIKESVKYEECMLCGCTDSRVLAVHHLDKDRKNNNIENLEWLCMNCHNLVHRHGVKLP